MVVSKQQFDDRERLLVNVAFLWVKRSELIDWMENWFDKTSRMDAVLKKLRDETVLGVSYF